MAKKPKKKAKPRVRDVLIPGQGGARMITDTAAALRKAMKKKKKKK